MKSRSKFHNSAGAFSIISLDQFIERTLHTRKPRIMTVTYKKKHTIKVARNTSATDSIQRAEKSKMRK